MLVVFGLTTGEFVIAGILPEVATGLSVSIPAAGLLVTAYALGMIVGGPVVTVLTARLARKPLIVGLIAVSVIGNVGSAVAPDYAVLLVSRFVAGLVVATFFAVAITTAVSMAPAGKQASSVAKVALGLNLGIILGTPVGTGIGQNLGWRATFVTVFTYIAPLLTDVSGFTGATVPALLLVFGAGVVVGNFLGGWLSDKALMPSLIGLLTVLAGILALFWLVSGVRVAAGILTFVIGALWFAIIPGMQTRVMTTASAAPTLAVAVNASGFQLAAAFAGWLGGQVISGGLGLRSIYLIGALLTVGGLVIAVYSLRRDRRQAAVPADHAPVG